MFNEHRDLNKVKANVEETTGLARKEEESAMEGDKLESRKKNKKVYLLD